MAVKAKATITISRIVDIQSVTRYYLLQSSTASAPSKPTANPPGGNWVTVEPAFQNGTTYTLYFVDLTIFTNGTYSYSAVSKSSSYEAAKEAWNKANNAQNTANSAANKIDNLTIGGRNLLPNSKDLSASIYSIGGGSIEKDTYNGFKIVTGVCNKDTHFTDILAYNGKISPKTDTYYTLSFYAKASKNGFIMRSFFHGNCTVKINAPDGNSSGNFSNSGDGMSDNILTTEWKRYWVRWKTSSSVSGAKNVLICRLQADVNHSTNDGVQVWVCAPKLEESNIATDWTPAPEDIEVRITEAETNIEQNKEDISLRATKTELTTSAANTLASAKTYSDAQLKVQADRITSVASRTTNAESNISKLQQTANGFSMDLRRLSGDPNNYSQLNVNTASSWGFNYDNTADGRWYTPKTMARDLPISNYYECLGGEKFKIEFEISTSIKGSSKNGGTDQVFVGTTVEIFGYDDTNKPNSYLLSTPMVSGQSTRIMGTDAATPVKVAGSITIPTKCRRFRVYIQTDGWGNWAGTLKIRNIVVSKINAVSDAASTAQSTANTARTEAANAAKTATNYLGFSSAGLTVGDLSKDTLGNNVNINSNNVDIRNGQKVLARYGAETIIYNDEKEAFTVKTSSIIAKAMDSSDKTVLYKQSNYSSTEQYKTNGAKGDNKWMFPHGWTVNLSTSIVIDRSEDRYFVWHLIYDGLVPSGGTTEPDNINYILVYFPKASSNITITSLSWTDSNQGVVKINNQEFQCCHCDARAVISMILDGGVWINNSSDINGLAEGIPPLAIGKNGGKHLEIDNNEIAAKSNNVTPSHLYLNMEGGNVSVNNNCDRAIMFQDGAIFAKNSSFSNGTWLGIVDGLNESGNTTFGYGGYLNEIGATNIYGKDINLTSKGDIVANTSFIVPNGSSFQGTNTSGQLRNNFQPCNTNNNCAIGYGSYSANEGTTTLYGNNVTLASKKDLNLSYEGTIRVNGSLYDSGWKTPTLVSTMTNYGSDSKNAVKYRKIGSVVDIAGAVSPKATTTLAKGAAVTLFTLPEAYRPSYTRSFLCQGSARYIFLLQIGSNGTVTISRYRNSTSTTDAYPTSVSTDSWLTISATFFVD